MAKKAKRVAKAAVKREPPKPARAPAPSKLKSSKSDELDLRTFPPESLVTTMLGVCLACALDVLIRHLRLSPERAQSEIRRHSPTLEELSAIPPARPYMAWPAEACPSCGAPPKWHAPLTIVKIEGGKATDAARRALLKKIGKNANFTIIEQKSTEREALYSWLSTTGASLDLDSRGWLLEAARHWLGRRLPKEEWTEIFRTVRFVRRSRQLQDGFAIEGPRLFLTPELFDEILLIQYLLSRSHKAGGQTFEGRLTLKDLFHRLRGGGHLRRAGIAAGNPAEALEQLLEIQGGEGRLKFHHIVDRRAFLSRLVALKDARIPRPK